MKLIQTFCQGRQLLLQDSKKLSKYLKMAIDTPVTYPGVKKSLGYNSIFNSQLNYDNFNTEILSSTIQLVKRDIKHLEFDEFTTWLSSINNYLTLSKSEYPQNEPEFQNFLNGVIDQGSLHQKFLVVIHTILYYDSRITLYSQLVSQLKQQLREFCPTNYEEQAIKIYWELLDSFDQKRIEMLIENPENIGEIGIEMDDRQITDFLNIMDNVVGEVSQYHLYMKLILYEIQVRILKQSDAELNSHQMQTLFIIGKQCNDELDGNLSKLNNFQLTTYIQLVGVMNNQQQLLTWECIYNELNNRDLSTMTVLDSIKLLYILLDLEKGNSKIYDKFIEKLYNQMNLIGEGNYSSVCLLLAKCESQYQQKFLRRLYNKLNFQTLSASHLATIMHCYFSCDLLNAAALNKFMPAIESQVNTLTMESLQTTIQVLVTKKRESEALYRFTQTLKLSKDVDPDLLNNIMLYCVTFEPKSPMVKTIQQAVLEILNKEYDEEIISEFMSVIVSIEPQSELIELLPEMRALIGKEIHKNHEGDEKMQSICEIITHFYNIK